MALAPDALIDHPFAFGLRLVGGNVGLRGRANVELQPPTPPPADFAAPQIERADFGQPGVQGDADSFRRRNGKRGQVQFVRSTGHRPKVSRAVPA